MSIYYQVSRTDEILLKPARSNDQHQSRGDGPEVNSELSCGPSLTGQAWRMQSEPPGCPANGTRSPASDSTRGSCPSDASAGGSAHLRDGTCRTARRRLPGSMDAARARKAGPNERWRAPAATCARGGASPDPIMGRSTDRPGAGGIAARNAPGRVPTARWRPEALRIQGGPAQRKRPGRSRALRFLKHGDRRGGRGPGAGGVA